MSSQILACHRDLLCDSYLAKADSALHDCNNCLIALLQPFPLSCSSKHGQIRGLEVSEVKKELQLSETELFRDRTSISITATAIVPVRWWPRLSKCLRAIGSFSFAVCSPGLGMGRFEKGDLHELSAAAIAVRTQASLETQPQGVCVGPSRL